MLSALWTECLTPSFRQAALKSSGKITGWTLEQPEIVMSSCASKGDILLIPGDPERGSGSQLWRESLARLYPIC